MSFIKVMQERYATKMYDADKKIPADKIEELKEILRLSPSSINSQPWHFTFVSDKETKAKLAEASFFNADKVNDCDTVVVFSAIDDIDLFEKQINKNLPEGAVGYYNNFIKPLPEAEIKNWQSKQVYLALGVLLSACAEMKIDTTPMEGIETDKYDAVLQTPHYKTIVAVAMGYRDENDSFQPVLKPKSRLAADELLKVV